MSGKKNFRIVNNQDRQIQLMTRVAHMIMFLYVPVVALLWFMKSPFENYVVWSAAAALTIVGMVGVFFFVQLCFAVAALFQKFRRRNEHGPARMIQDKQESNTITPPELMGAVVNIWPHLDNEFIQLDGVEEPVFLKADEEFSDNQGIVTNLSLEYQTATVSNITESITVPVSMLEVVQGATAL